MERTGPAANRPTPAPQPRGAKAVRERETREPGRNGGWSSWSWDRAPSGRPPWALTVSGACSSSALGLQRDQSRDHQGKVQHADHLLDHHHRASMIISRSDFAESHTGQAGEAEVEE